MTSFASLAALGLALSAPAPSTDPLPSDAGARVERVAEGVFAILHDDATDEWPHGNTGVVVGRDAVLVVDSAYLPSRARADVALIRRLTPKPVRWLVITHWHFDHNNGTVAYRKAYPGVTVVAERESAALVGLNATYWSRLAAAPGSRRAEALAKKEAELAAATDAAARAALEKVVRQRRAELAELAALEVVVPDLTFERSLGLDLGGGRTVEIRDQGRANSPHDTTILVPDARVVFTGDVVVQSPLPYVSGSWPVPWIAVLRGLEALAVSAWVPGHGPVLRDPGYLRQVRGLLEAATSRAEALARQGRTLEQAQQELRLDDLRVAPWTGAALDADWKETVEGLAERAYRGVRGMGG